MNRRYSTYLLLFYCSFIFANNLSGIQRKAIAGDSAAQYKLGYNYYVGGGFAQDYKMALHWYSLAAEQDFRQTATTSSTAAGNGCSGGMR